MFMTVDEFELFVNDAPLVNDLFGQRDASACFNVASRRYTGDQWRTSIYADYIPV